MYLCTIWACVHIWINGYIYIILYLYVCNVPQPCKILRLTTTINNIWTIYQFNNDNRQVLKLSTWSKTKIQLIMIIVLHLTTLFKFNFTFAQSMLYLITLEADNVHCISNFGRVLKRAIIDMSSYAWKCLFLFVWLRFRCKLR